MVEINRVQVRQECLHVIKMAFTHSQVVELAFFNEFFVSGCQPNVLLFRFTEVAQFLLANFLSLLSLAMETVNIRVVLGHLYLLTKRHFGLLCLSFFKEF